MKKILVYFFFATVFIIQIYGQIQWQKDPNNPVLIRGTNGEWDDELVAGPYILFDGATYHMWYAGYDGSTGTNIGYAASLDGINWTKYDDPTTTSSPYANSDPVFTSGPSGSWDEIVVYQPSVLFDGTIYHMWYSGHNDPANRKIGYATSPDGISWTKYNDPATTSSLYADSDPVLTPGLSGSWDDEWVDSPEVLLIDGVYHMWYSGFDGIIYQTGHATSPDGINWTQDSLNPVLKPGAAGSWDNGSAYQPSVLIDQDSVYHMFYSGGVNVEWSIGYAYSMDGRNWIKYGGNPVMTPGSNGSWDDTFNGLAGVFFNADSTGFDMWYTGGTTTQIANWDIGYAKAPKASFDFKNNPLVKYKYNPVFRRGSNGKWDSHHALAPSILYDGNVYRIWYGGYDGGEGSQTGYAYSSDGISWERYPDPVVLRGSSGSWDDYSIFQPSVIFDSVSNQYKMWFCGHDGNFDNRKIGYATSPDTIQWTVYGSHPVLTPGPPGSWDDLWVESPNVLFIDGIYHMWYDGSDGTYVQIGHATSLNGIDWEKDILNPVLGVGSIGSWDAGVVDNPCVIFDGNAYHMWYGGQRSYLWNWRIGYAYSYDGSNWIKSSVDNPVLGVGDPGSWDDQFVGVGGVAAMVFLDSQGNRKLKMWYGGGPADLFGDIGYVTDLVVSVEDNILNVVPNSFSLLQNYPNPFNPTTKIRYQIQSRSLVSLRIYNILGELVATLVNEVKPVGTYELSWNAENLPSGVYFYQLQAGNFVDTKKLVLLK